MKGKRPSCFIIQPGAFGDIITCAPIAKHFADNNYEVFWAVHEKYKEHLGSITSEYVTSVTLEDIPVSEGDDWLRVAASQCYGLVPSYDMALDLADRHPYGFRQLPAETPEEAKYRVSKVVPFEKKNHLSWKRNTKKEKTLYSKVVGDLGEYVIGALESSRGDKTEVPASETRRVIEITPQEGYNIVDWCEVIARAKAVYCVESAVQCFVDGCIFQLPEEQPKYLLKRSTITNDKPYTVAKYWDLSYF